MVSDAMPLSVAQCAALACLFEASAAKPGNVHRGADFADVSFVDFVSSAVAIGPELDVALSRAVGETILAAVEATRRVVGTNTNLGIVLLLAPLAKVPREIPIAQGITPVLAALDRRDTERAYEAIRLAQPSGLGQVDQADVHQPPPLTLQEVMRLAENRDLVARQYTNDFFEVREHAAASIIESVERGRMLDEAIIETQLRLLSRFPDSLIARKCGPAVAAEASARAADVLNRQPSGQEAFCRALDQFDAWLRADGNRRNPGTTADLIAAALFILLRDGQLSPPWRFIDS